MFFDNINRKSNERERWSEISSHGRFSFAWDATLLRVWRVQKINGIKVWQLGFINTFSIIFKCFMFIVSKVKKKCSLSVLSTTRMIISTLNKDGTLDENEIKENRKNIKRGNYWLPIIRSFFSWSNKNIRSFFVTV